MAQLPLDGSIEAEYADGYVHSETELGDVSPFDNSRNVFYDVLNKLPEGEHGQMIRFTLFYKNMRYDIPWLDVPESARPIRYKKMEMDYNGPLAGQPRMMTVGFGYQYNDENGKNVQEVVEL